MKTQTNKLKKLHHKFCLIDSGKQGAKVLFGSLNLTMQAFSKNYDCVIVTDDKFLVNNFREAFEDLWATFKNFE